MIKNSVKLFIFFMSWVAKINQNLPTCGLKSLGNAVIDKRSILVTWIQKLQTKCILCTNATIFPKYLFYISKLLKSCVSKIVTMSILHTIIFYGPYLYILRSFAPCTRGRQHISCRALQRLACHSETADKSTRRKHHCHCNSPNHWIYP